MSAPPDLVARFRGRRVVVLGDLAADCFVETRPDRLSREAPVMVLRYERRRYAPGCAANTAMNLCALGAEVLPIGFLGGDEPGAAIRALLRDAGVATEGIAPRGGTPLKVRITSGDFSRPKQQVLRVDVHPEEDAEMVPLLDRLSVAAGAEAIVVSDYGYGAATPDLLRRLRAIAPEALVSVDSRHCAGEFADVDLLTPNEGEASEALRRRVETDEEAATAAAELRSLGRAGAVLLTRGNRGMVLAEAGGVRRLAISGSAEIVDPTGAGDTVVAVAALVRVAGGGYLDAARMANFAAGVKVMKSGPATVSPAELLAAAARGGPARG